MNLDQFQMVLPLIGVTVNAGILIEIAGPSGTMKTSIGLVLTANNCKHSTESFTYYINTQGQFPVERLVDILSKMTKKIG